uniref:Glycosyltransferase family 2 protein n=4 Tax=unclassified Prevotella TaxID=2638335 RepID=A0AB33JR21_9BACT
MITFTIVTCTYCAEHVLQRTVDSVLRQSYGKVEHLIIDGASTDGTLAIVQRYIQANEEVGMHRVVLKSEPDRGLYDAMNKGIMEATGDYLVFLNAGDVFPYADTLELVAGQVGEDEELPGVLYGDTDVVDDDGAFLYHRRLSPPEHLTWRSFRQGMLVCHQAFYARTDIARCNPYNLNYRLSADVDWCIRVMKDTENRQLSLRHLHMVVVNYLEGGMSIKNHRASLRERFLIMCHHYGLFTTYLMHAWFIIRNLVKR